MTFGGGVDVENAKGGVVFVKFFRRDFSGNNLTEDALLFLQFGKLFGRHIFNFFFECFTLFFGHFGHGLWLGEEVYKSILGGVDRLGWGIVFNNCSFLG